MKTQNTIQPQEIPLEQDITIDITESQLEIAYANQYDNNTSTVHCHIQNNGVDLDVSQYQVTLRVRKSNGKGYSATIGKTGIEGNVTGNIVSFKIPKYITVSHGRQVCDLEFYTKDDIKKYSCTFYIRVNKSALDEKEVLDSDYYASVHDEYLKLEKDLNAKITEEQNRATQAEQTVQTNAQTYTDTKIADLINGAPSTLDTLGELADAISENQTVMEALNNAIGTKVDKVEGKGLSTEDYTTEEKNKLNSMPTGEEIAVSVANAKESETNAAESAVLASDNAEDAFNSSVNAMHSWELAAEKADAAAESAMAAAESVNSALNNSSDALISALNAEIYATDAEIYAKQSQSYAVGGTDIREDEDVDNSKYYYEQAKSISESFSGALRPMGTVTFANLPSLSSASNGDMYNISDQFITNSNFKEGAGIVIPAGSNAYKTADGKWDVLAGSPVSGVKGNKESTYRTGNVNLTPENIGALSVDGTTMHGPGTYATVAPDFIQIENKQDGAITDIRDGYMYVKSAEDKEVYIEGSGINFKENNASVGTLTSTQYSGNAATATKAIQDGNGNNIADTYVKKSGDTINGNLAVAGDIYTTWASNGLSNKFNEVFQSVSEGKNKIASAITDKGISTDATATFDTMADNIGKISGNGKVKYDITHIITMETAMPVEIVIRGLCYPDKGRNIKIYINGEAGTYTFVGAEQYPKVLNITLPANMQQGENNIRILVETRDIAVTTMTIQNIVEIPALTSNETEIEGRIYRTSASSNYVGYGVEDAAPWRPFDKTEERGIADCWHPNSGVPQWLMLELPYDMCITGFTMQNRLSYIECPKDIIFQGSNDAENWEDIKSFIFSVQAERDITKEVQTDNRCFYKYYRWYLETVNSYGVISKIKDIKGETFKEETTLQVIV